MNQYGGKANKKGGCMYFNSQGVDIYYEVIGSGKPVILIHGFMADFQSNWGGNRETIIYRFSNNRDGCQGARKERKTS